MCLWLQHWEGFRGRHRMVTGLAWRQLSSNFRERFCVQEIMWSVTEQDTCPHLNTAQGQTCESIAHLCIPHSRHLTITPIHHNKHNTITPTHHNRHHTITPIHHNRHNTITPIHHSRHRMITSMHKNCCWSCWLGFIKKNHSMNFGIGKNFQEIQP